MRLVANLLCERDWAAAAALDAGRPAPPTPPARLLREVALAGAGMRALARPGDTLWLPAPVDPAELPAEPRAPGVAIEWGPLGALPRSPLLCWGETEETARARPAECAVRAGPSGDGWVDLVRSLRAPTAATQARANHRRVALDVATELGAALPGARFVESAAQLVEHVRAGGAAASPAGRWVLKAPWSAAGRERLRGRGDALPEPDRRRLASLLAVHGELLFEPWMERTEDFGSLGVVAGGRVRTVGFHRQETAGGGAVRAIVPLGAEGPPGGLSDEEARSFHAAIHAAGRRLLALGYEGPFGVDAWRHRDAGGTTRFQPLGECNARLTLGALAWARRAGCA